MNSEDDLRKISSISKSTIDTFGKHGSILVRALFKHNPKAYINLLRESLIKDLNDAGIEDGDVVNVCKQVKDFMESTGPTNLTVISLKKLNWDSLDVDFEIDFSKIKIGLKRRSMTSENYEVYGVYPTELIKKNADSGTNSYIFYEFF